MEHGFEAIPRDTRRMTSVIGFIEGPDLLVVLAIVLVLFGGSKLPQLARSLGLAKKEFEAATDENAEPQKTVTTVVASTPAPTAPVAGSTIQPKA